MAIGWPLGWPWDVPRLVISWPWGNRSLPPQARLPAQAATLGCRYATAISVGQIVSSASLRVRNVRVKRSFPRSSNAVRSQPSRVQELIPGLDGHPIVMVIKAGSPSTKPTGPSPPSQWDSSRIGQQDRSAQAHRLGSSASKSVAVSPVQAGSAQTARQMPSNSRRRPFECPALSVPRPSGAATVSVPAMPP